MRQIKNKIKMKKTMREYYTKETVFENSPAIVCIEYNGFFFFF